MCALNWKGLRKKANQPIVLQLKHFFPLIFPEITWRSAGMIGGYNPSSIGGGHEYGLAADIYVRVTEDNEKKVGMVFLICLCGMLLSLESKRSSGTR